jgi:urea transporter
VGGATIALQTWERAADANPVVGFVDELLRGIGQVMFQNSPLTGLFFLIGLFVGSWESGLYALFGTAISTLTAHWLGVPSGLIKMGLHGYNGTLVGIGLAFYLADTAWLPVYVLVACMIVTIVTAAIGNVVGTWQLPALTAPFVVTTWIFALGMYGFDRIEAGAESRAPVRPAFALGERASLGFRDILDGFLLGPAEVFFQGKVIVGVLFLAGILVSSRIDFGMAVAGSLVGLGTGWVLGMDAGTLTAGLAGYNAVLTMMALGGLFYVLDVNSVTVAFLAAIGSVVTFVALEALVAPSGGHVYTAPFVLVTWLFIAARPFLHRLRTVPPADATTPEGNINLYRLKGHWWDRRSEP